MSPARLCLMSLVMGCLFVSACQALGPPKRTKNSVHKITAVRIGFRLRNSTINGPINIQQDIFIDKRHYSFRRSFTNRGRGRMTRFNFEELVNK
jgi:hypothetical protein